MADAVRVSEDILQAAIAGSEMGNRKSRLIERAVVERERRRVVLITDIRVGVLPFILAIRSFLVGNVFCQGTDVSKEIRRINVGQTRLTYIMG